MGTNIEPTGSSPGIWMSFTPLKNAMSTPIANTDLTQRPPRSMRSRLGGFVLLPRILDKGRATLAGKTANITTTRLPTNTSSGSSASILKRS